MQKQLVYIFLALCLFGELSSQSFTPNHTYTYSRTYLESVTYSASNPDANNNAKQIQTVQYTDGLGRPMQDINIGATYNGNDLITSYFYDSVTGRQTKQYLPITKTSLQGAMQTISEADINSYYSVANAFAEVKTEDSPLMRPVETASPGDAWQMAGGKTQKKEYLFNGQNEVKKYIAFSESDESVFYPTITSGNYNANTLYKIKSTDEDGNITYTFKNGLGQIILIRTLLEPIHFVNSKETVPSTSLAINFLDTYYVYNQYGQLVLIIPPKASALSLSQDVKDQLCYIYRYDAKGRLIEKKLPGKGKEEMVYDRSDRLILYRDARMGAQNQWLLTKYDKYGRVVYTGFLHAAGRAALQDIIKDMVITESPSSTGFTRNGMQIYYTNEYFLQFSEALSVSYYDEYPTGAPAKPSLITETALSSDNLAAHSTKTMPTASYVKNISDDRWTKTYYWYDERGRSIGAQEINHLGGITTTHTEKNWAGITTRVETEHQRTANVTAAVKVKERFVYNDRNYLEEHYHQVNANTEELLAKYTYNELGQVTNKKVGNNLQSIDYDYNIRGWLTDINNVNMPNSSNKLFAYHIAYESRTGLETPNLDFPNHKVVPRYNGNIAEVSWKASPYWGASPERQGFVYDSANRVLAGFYQSPSNPSNKSYSEVIKEYDPNGNITKLKRTGRWAKGVTANIDDLTYNLSGNRINSITDLSNNFIGYEGGGGTIGYDNNGNMTSMPDKGISVITYNFLNLPEQIQQTNTTSYDYRADGVKLKKKFVLNNDAGSHMIYTEYLDGFVYVTQKTTALRAAMEETDPATVEATRASEVETFTVAEESMAAPGGPPSESNPLVLSYFPTSEGYYDYRHNRYIYQYKDHLGNVRLSYAQNSATNQIEILDRNDYYPFGMNFLSQQSVYDATGTPLNYKYNQKELQETGFYDYGWRQYMPDLGRWFGMDKLSESYSSTSPYAYVMNNPVMMFDPDGRFAQNSNWLQDIWNNTSKHSHWENNGNGSFSGGEVIPGSDFGSGFSGFGVYSALPMGMGNNGGGENMRTIDLPGVTVNGKSSGWRKELVNKFVEMMDQFNKDNEKAFDWYGPSGQANWFFGAAATFSGIKGGLNAERMYGQGIRGGLAGNYALTGRNLSQFGKMPATKASMPISSVAKWGGIASKASFFAGVIMDDIAVANGEISREKANFNAVMGAYGLTGVGTIPSMLYFGIDSFYLGGWDGAMNDTAIRQAEFDRIINANLGMPRQYIFPYGSQKF